MDIRFLLNGETVELADADPTRPVLDWLRETRGLKGTKEGCNEGDCGACSVLLSDEDGVKPANACLMLLGHLDGKALHTVEALSAAGGTLHPVQQALIDHHGSQCGFCTPGIAVSLAAGHLNGEQDHDAQLAGNLCRCTGYAPIIRAAEAAARAPVPAGFAAALRTLPDGHAAAEPLRPESADALADAVMENPHAVLINGGTDVGLRLTKGLERLDRVIFLDGVSDLKRIDPGEQSLRFGAGVTIERLRAVMAEYHAHFAALLRRFASAQIRAVGTVGGNIGNGSPVADTPPAWIALGAVLHLRRGEARRELPLEEYYLGPGRQDRQAGEFIEAVSIPRQEDRLRVYKLSKRFDQDISSVLGAFNITLRDGIVQSARIAFGGMAATPKRAGTVEATLMGKAWTLETVEAAMAAFEADFTPLSDIRGRAEYRAQSARNMLLRVWLEDQGETVSLREVAP